MARVLLVGCGGRGRALAAELIAAGHAVRGTTRSEANLAAIGGIGAEAVLADPNRLATIHPRLEGVSALCWLMATVEGDPESIAAIHGDRLESLLAALVDTPVRGLVYEAAGPVEPAALARGAELVQAAAERHHMPVALIRAHPGERETWLTEARAAVDSVLN